MWNGCHEDEYGKNKSFHLFVENGPTHLIYTLIMYEGSEWDSRRWLKK